VPTRNLVYDCLVLRARESPAGDRILSLLTAEEGLTDVFVFGGPKSKLRSLASPYASGKAFVYLDPVKDFRKLADFDVIESYPALREDLDRLWSASLVAELLVKTSGGGGDFHIVVGLARSCLAALDSASPGATEPALVLFLWRLVEFLGLGPDPRACSSCGREFVFRRSLDEAAPAPMAGAYSFENDEFLCPLCASRSGRCLPLGQGALRWLTRSLDLPYDDAVKLPLLPETLGSLKTLCFALARMAAEAPLVSLEKGASGA
jgi:DNA repair protein RecO (recombination protein O)